ncbi:MAG TPA: hypothetical protein VLY23_03665 [Candidatus Acidoferrum sp.]|nr:hypothetical protein [Candidatus Acidoferrum sp.]
MNLRIPVIALLVAFAWPATVFADGVGVKCSVNEERVWLYDSVATLNVAAKLKCGDNVEVLGRENGYVKVRAADGTVGYVPESDLPKSSIPAEAAPTPDAKPVTQPSLASLARAAAAARMKATASANPIAPSTPAPAVAATAAPVPVAASTQPAATAEVVPAPQPKTVAVSATTSKPTAPANAVTPASRNAANSPTEVPASAHSTTSASRTRTKSAARPNAAAAVPGRAPSNPTPQPARPSPAPALHTAVATSSSANPAPQTAAVVANDIYIGGDSKSPAPKAAAVRPVADTSDNDDDDSYLTRPKSESDDPACEVYFSSYGLSPGQFKWMVDNRQKKYPTVCPAGSPSMVDYVIIFTHDVDFFNYTMPTPVHVEAGGFSDWNPMVTYDTSVVAHNDVDKSKREYVWVFHVKRGAFDPVRFSPHRRFQFTKTESKYSHTIEDAFDFIENQNPNR